MRQKKWLYALCLSLVLCTACAKQGEAQSVAPPAPQANAQDNTTAPAPAEKPAGAAQTAPDTQTAAPTVPDEQVTELLGALDYIDQIGGGNLPFDTTASFTGKDGATYAKVVNTQFATTADLRAFLTDYLTEQMIAARYSGIVDTDAPRYVEVDGTLYGKQAPTSCGFTWTGKAELKDVSEKGYTILAEIDDFGSTRPIEVQVVLQDGKPKINALTL